MAAAFSAAVVGSVYLFGWRLSVALIRGVGCWCLSGPLSVVALSRGVGPGFVSVLQRRGPNKRSQLKRPNEGAGGFRVPRRDRRASPLAAEFLLRLLPSGSDRVHRVPNSSGTLRSPLDTRETKVQPCRPRVNASLLNSPRVVGFGRLLATPRRASGSGGLLAERVGFEPTEGLHLHLISNQARSTGLRHLSRSVSP